MFDIALGIDSEISGYDNIRLRGLILGLTAHEIEERMRRYRRVHRTWRLSRHSGAHLFGWHDDAFDIRRSHLFCPRNTADGRMDHGRRRGIFGQGAASDRIVRVTSQYPGTGVA